MKFILTLISLFFTLPLFAQSTDSGDWVRIESENKEISFAFPKEYSYAFDKKGLRVPNPKNLFDAANYTNLRSLTAHKNGVTMFFESYDSGQSKRTLPYFLGLYSKGRYQNLKFGDFAGLSITNDETAFTTYYYLASSKHTYLIGIGAKDGNNPMIKEFLASVKLGGKNAFGNITRTLPEPSETISLPTLVETPITISYENEKSKGKNVTAPAQQPVQPVGNRESVNVFFKPRAGYTVSARQSGVQGELRLRVFFSANGLITSIAVVDDLDDGLAKNAILAAKRIRFLPAMKDNAPVTVTKMVLYSFTLF
jgi:hypothetical protein